MRKSNRVRFSELRQAYRLLHECRDIGHDPAAWHRLMLTGLIELVGAKCAASGVIRATPEPNQLPTNVHIAEVGPEQWPRYCRDYVRSQVFARTVTYQCFAKQLFEVIGRRGLGPRDQLFFTRSHEQLFSQAEWARSDEFNELRKPIGIDDQLTTCRLVSPAAIHGLALHRALGDRPFSIHERRLLHLFHDELARHVGTALCWEPDPGFAQLPPRLRQTLFCLLDGDSEKQVAAHLGLSRHTVHEYVSTLYRRFGVSSRPELLVRCLRRRPPGFG